MAFGHEKLDVYRAAIGYVGWVYRFCEALAGHRNAKDQLLRAAQAIPLNIAEGNGNSASEGMRFTKKRKSTGRIKSTPIPIPTPRENHDRQQRGGDDGIPPPNR